MDSTSRSPGPVHGDRGDPLVTSGLQMSLGKASQRARVSGVPVRMLHVTSRILQISSVDDVLTRLLRSVCAHTHTH